MLLRDLLSAKDASKHEMMSLINNSARVDARYDEGRTPLHVAVEVGSCVGIVVLIETNADIHAKDAHLFGRTPIRLAAELNSASVLRLLVQKRADIHTLA